MIFTILIAVFSIIGLLVIHEFGHFVVAKKFGVKVEEFGVGYPPRLFGKKIGQTLYSINLIPFGAFVKIPEDDQRFAGKPVWQRALILLGGVVSFWIVAAILLSIVFGIGAPVAISDTEPGPLINPKVQILAVAPHSPAEKAGIKPGDTIKEFNKVKEVQEFTEANKGKVVTLIIERGEKKYA